MTFKEENHEIEHIIILKISDKEFLCHDYIFELPDNDDFIVDTLEIEYEKDKDGNETDKIINKMFHVREKNTWWSFPLYEIINDQIVSFDYTQYQYFSDTDRRMGLAKKISKLYNPSSEAKILRKTFKYIMDALNIGYPDFFKKYNDKVEDVINKNPKN